MEKTIIEVNGIKLEVDLRTAKRVDTLRVGDRVKVMLKGYSSEYKVYPGTVAGFEPFQNLPTVIVAYLESDYSGSKLKFLYFNSQSKETEVIKAIDDDQLDIEKANILQHFDKEEAKIEAQLDEIRRTREYFLANFKAYWPEMTKVEA